MREKICFGGTFNPIHNGHLICARAASEAVGAKTVVIFPAGNPAHRGEPADLADVGDRLAMCRSAIEGIEGFEVDDRECRRTGPTYTIDTARELKREGWNEVTWLIGADMLNTLPKWHEAEKLLQDVKFLVMARPGVEFEWDRLPEEVRALKKNVVRVPQIDISGTEIRRRAMAGLSIDYLCPEGVCGYIRETGLYGIRPSTGSGPLNR
jgi:nicotinate-nucleotide adenylyltransferase